MPHVNKQMASFFLTTRCNLSCEYCYNRQERSQMVEQSLSIEIAKTTVDMFLERVRVGTFVFMDLGSQHKK